MYCRFCGKIIDDDSSFCRYCGKSITNEVSVENFRTPEKDETVSQKRDISTVTINRDIEDSRKPIQEKIIKAAVIDSHNSQPTDNKQQETKYSNHNKNTDSSQSGNEEGNKSKKIILTIVISVCVAGLIWIAITYPDNIIDWIYCTIVIGSGFLLRYLGHLLGNRLRKKGLNPKRLSKINVNVDAGKTVNGFGTSYFDTGIGQRMEDLLKNGGVGATVQYKFLTVFFIPLLPIDCMLTRGSGVQGRYHFYADCKFSFKEILMIWMESWGVVAVIIGIVAIIELFCNIWA